MSDTDRAAYLRNLIADNRDMLDQVGNELAILRDLGDPTKAGRKLSSDQRQAVAKGALAHERVFGPDYQDFLRSAVAAAEAELAEIERARTVALPPG